MKGLFLRSIVAIALLLWAIDMVFPWQRIMQSEENHYSAILQQKKLTVGTINNSVSYFIGSEGQSGLEYELSRAFADYLGVGLDVKVMSNSDELFDALENNDIDIAAANLLFQPQKADRYQIGPAYYSASWQLAYRKGEVRPKSLGDIKGKLAIINGSELTALLQDAKLKYSDLQWTTEKSLNQEELLLKVANGQLDYTIANSIDISAVQQIRPEIDVAFDLTDESSVHWYLPTSSYSELQSALLDFMNGAIESGLIARIEEKYFNHFSNFDYVDTRSYLQAIEKILPKYQPHFEKYRGDLDWRLLAAIAYQESHWVEDATSPTGVRGIMMLTKDTADRMKITNRINAEQSIKAGAGYLHLLMNQMPETIPQEDRIWYALAAYNMGLGHLLDVRRLTKELGGDPDNWLDVKKNLPLLAEKKYYSKLKYGYARGYEAYQYVENIRRYMNSIMNYHRVQEEQANTQAHVTTQTVIAERNAEIPENQAVIKSETENKQIKAEEKQENK
ncbi:membrane-bound lytic murein transglycosylase F [Cricetibacter osteomyelitidis]|uniref:Membrane-bound lytic murein transglycosylase F n=1 Tax=Cricetibacter osteomyelitidis TaxID=1521931 RepID=A0A4R2T5R7_9PAST|nr:membrane-bound lytic murein transglycosylase MltF [Cricetibacter osteomyelitidis]TCP96194.1 membrane-bound lytic murein transglycosylase F [Cricetibacter osteomyelitidis]